MNADDIQDLTSLQAYLMDFAEARDWQKFHAPKNLSMALAVEAAELMEHFQWMTEQESWALTPEQKKPVAEELADIQMYLALLAQRLNIDLGQAVRDKAKKNEVKYPTDKVKGLAKKYTEY